MKTKSQEEIPIPDLVNILKEKVRRQE
jgi:hypothetical protein